jgi:hypothetical protein
LTASYDKAYGQNHHPQAELFERHALLPPQDCQAKPPFDKESLKCYKGYKLPRGELAGDGLMKSLFADEWRSTAWLQDTFLRRVFTR